MTTTGTTPGAARFITGTTPPEVAKRAASLTATAADFKATGEEIVSASAAAHPTVPAQRPDLSTAIPRLLVATPNPTVRAASARAPSATTTMGDRKGVFRHAEAPASVAEEHMVAAVAPVGIGNRSFVKFLVVRRT